MFPFVPHHRFARHVSDLWRVFFMQTRRAHIDIAGTAMLSEKNTYRPKGGSGFGVRLLVEFLENLAK